MSDDYAYTIASVEKPGDEPVEVELGESIPFGIWEELREITRCTGHCCRSFTLGDSPVELGQRVIQARQTKTGVSPETAEWMATALVYQGESVKPPSGLNNIAKPPAPPGHRYEPSKKPAYWYGCRHLTDGSCGIYETRPDVCRDYPYKGNQCHNPGCARRTTMAAGLSWWKAGGSDEELVKATEVEDGVDEEVREAAAGAQEEPRDEPGGPGQGDRSQPRDDQPVGAVLRGDAEVSGRHGARRGARGVGSVPAL